MELPGTEELVISLMSDLCPACRGWKRERNTLCGRCYGKLPRDVKRQLYCPEGYEPALKRAMGLLGAEAFALP